MSSKTHISLPPIDAFRRVDSSIWNVPFGLGMLCLISALVLFWLSFAEMNLAYTSFGPAAVPAWGRVKLMQAGIFSLVAAGLFIYNALRKKYGLVVNKEGLTFYRPFFAEEFIPWIAVQGVSFSQDQSSITAAKQDQRAALWIGDRQIVSLRKYVHPLDLPNVVTRVKAELYPQLETRLRDRLNAGNNADFGAIALNKKGLIWNQRLLPWDQINQVGVNKGIFEVELINHKHFRQSILRISNLEILILLIREFEIN